MELICLPTVKVMDLAVIPECYVDTNLIETLVPPKSRYNHQHGCGTVSKRMQENFSNSFALGIIDKDKNEIDYLSEFDELIHAGSLFLYKHKKLHHYIIQISPAIETFILTNAETAGLNLANFDLPTDFEKLRKQSKTTRSKEDDRFRRLFKAIRKSGSPEFSLLASWIQYLKENTYQVDMEVLRALE